MWEHVGTRIHQALHKFIRPFTNIPANIVKTLLAIGPVVSLPAKWSQGQAFTILSLLASQFSSQWAKVWE